MDNSKKYFEEAKKIIQKHKRYIIKLDKVAELKEGKTKEYLATITPYTRVYISGILNGRTNIEKDTIIAFLKPLIKESVKLKEMYEKKGIDYIINYFFKEI